MNPRLRRLLIPGLLVLLVVVVVLASLTDDADADPTEVARLSDPRITESSGLAVSVADPGLVYTINDSGSAPEVYAVSLTTGATVGVTRLEGVTWFDPEALSIGPDGTLWVADTGDNGRQRQKPMLYAFDEPGPGDSTVTPTTYLLRHESGPVDVEAFAVDPAGGFVLVTKGVLSGELLRLEEPLSVDRPNPTVATGVAMPGLVTDAVFTPDGKLAVRTYADVEIRAGDGTPTGETLQAPGAEQAETIAAEPDGSLLVGSEGAASPLHRLTRTAAPAPASSAPVPAPGAGEDWWERPVGPWIVGGTVAAGLAAVVLRLRRRWSTAG